MKEKKTMTNVSSLSSSLGAQNKTKKMTMKSWLIVIFFGCTQTKEKETMMSIDLSLSSLSG